MKQRLIAFAALLALAVCALAAATVWLVPPTRQVPHTGPAASGPAPPGGGPAGAGPTAKKLGSAARGSSRNASGRCISRKSMLTPRSCRSSCLNFCPPGRF